MLAGIRDGLYLRMVSSVYDGKGLLLGPHSPFRNISDLKWIYFNYREQQYTVNTPTKLTKHSSRILLYIYFN